MERNANLKQIMEWLIYGYIMVIMLSENTGTTSVKFIRIAFIAFFTLYFITKHVHWKSWYLLLSVIFLLYNYIMCNFAFSANFAKTFTSTLLYVTAVDVCIYFFLCEYDITEGIIKAIIAGAIILSLRIYLTNGPTVFLAARKADNTSANLLGYYCAVAALLSFYLLRKYPQKRKIYITLTGMLIVFMFLSASRKSFLFLGIPLVFYYVVNAKDSAVLIRNIIIIAFVFLCAYLLVMNVPLFYRLVGRRIDTMIAGFNGETTDASTQTRLNLIEWGIDWFKKRPIFGYGLSNFRALMKRYHPGMTAFYSHNNYVELLVNCGIVGTVIYYLLYAVILVKSFIILRRNKDLLITFMTGLMIAGIVCEYGLVTYNMPIYQLLLMVTYVLVFDRNVKGVSA